MPRLKKRFEIVVTRKVVQEYRFGVDAYTKAEADAIADNEANAAADHLFGLVEETSREYEVVEKD